jgi:hypothetical protein
MQGRMLASLGAITALVMAAPASGAAPNQGDASKVLVVNNPFVSCDAPTPRDKVEGGGMGETIEVSDTRPIDFVTVKSGNGAFVVDSSFTVNTATITLSKDVSNYVVWVCPEDGTDPTDPPFPPPDDGTN